MTKISSLLTAVTLIALSATASLAQDKPAAEKPAATKKPAAAKPAVKLANATKNGKLLCPITSEEFTANADSEKSVYKGKTYAFCCAGCKPQFDKNPTKYVTQAKPSAKATKKGS